MNPIDHRKNWIAFVHQMQSKNPLTPVQFEHLAKIFKEILDGKDANEALGLKYKRGNTEGKAIARQKISLVLFWVACACESESDGGLGLTLNEAFIKASEVFEKFGYSPEMIEKYWYQEDKSHMRNALRGYFDQDSPL